MLRSDSGQGRHGRQQSPRDYVEPADNVSAGHRVHVPRRSCNDAGTADHFDAADLKNHSP